MRPVSDRFLRTVRGSHGASARARVCTTFQTGIDPDGTLIDILSGDVVLDATADVQATLSLQTTGLRMWPRRATDLLAPFGNELFVERGVEYGNGVTEWVSLGYYRLQTPSQEDAPDGPIDLAASDRMQGIIDSRLLAPRQFVATQTNGEVVDSLVLDVYPEATIEWDDSAVRDEPIGRSIVVEEDRFGGLNDVVTSVAKVAAWDYRGILVIGDLPDESEIVFDVDEGPTGVLTSLSRNVTREGVYNAVVATGEGPDQSTPVVGTAVDVDPLSPTYFYGRFGQVPRFYSSPLLTSEAAATAAAATILRKATGPPYEVTFEAVPNPALEPYDPIRVRVSTREGNELHVVETLTIPLLAADKMTGTTRLKGFS